MTFRRNNVNSLQKDIVAKEEAKEMSDVLKNVLKNVQKDDLKKITVRQSDVLELMVQNPRVTLQEISTRVKVSVKTIQRDFEVVKKLGISITRKGGRTYGEWVVKS